MSKQGEAKESGAKDKAQKGKGASAKAKGKQYPLRRRLGGGEEIIDDDALNFEVQRHAAKLKKIGPTSPGLNSVS